MPVWGVWTEAGFCFSTGEHSAKARNLTANPYCVVSTERGDEAVIVEGVVRATSDAAFVARAGELYFPKYQYKLNPSLGPIFVLRPRIAFGFIEFQLNSSATRWVFPKD
jgi:pyridoxamine 5'-phosphate oxidase-like protein